MGAHVSGDVGSPVTGGSSVLCSHSGDAACVGDSALAHWAADPANTAWMDSKRPAHREPPARPRPSPCPARGAHGPRASDLWRFPEALTGAAVTAATVRSRGGPSSRPSAPRPHVSPPASPCPAQAWVSAAQSGYGARCSDPAHSQPVPVPTETDSPVPRRTQGLLCHGANLEQRWGRVGGEASSRPDAAGPPPPLRPRTRPRF